ncbi:hypothetical protein CJA_2850 [Cellvibrio japonicus Ueda107]|uniref:Uncharacterized protein n=1 Tax=Cellvibrio japonicus (strain Ueda107) TaxID=498211 RepID=B3PC37_CELJU|nr:hypothetical protein CJA_2850 [Cellvibrio japonicus Ueda107]
MLKRHPVLLRPANLAGRFFRHERPASESVRRIVEKFD